jgi:uncharacterized protein YndB with AHSA1/START domain
MKPVEQTIAIDRPIAEVFTFVTDQRNAPEWQAGLVEVRPLVEGPPRVGTRYSLVRQFMGRRMEAVSEYLTYEPDKLVTFRTISGPEVEASYLFESVAGGTNVTSRVRLRIPGVMGLFDPLIRMSLRREMRVALPALKALLESRPDERSTPRMVETVAHPRPRPS